MVGRTPPPLVWKMNDPRKKRECFYLCEKINIPFEKHWVYNMPCCRSVDQKSNQTPNILTVFLYFDLNSHKMKGMVVKLSTFWSKQS